MGSSRGSRGRRATANGSRFAGIGASESTGPWSVRTRTAHAALHLLRGGRQV